MIPERRWLILPIEVKVREFDAHILFACHAVARGYGVVLGERGTVNSEYLAALPRAIYLDKTMARQKTKRITRCKDECGHWYASLDTEAAPHAGRLYTYARYSEEGMSKADAVLAWGDADKKAILKAYPQWSKKVICTGHPRMDLWGSRFREIYHAETERLQQKFGRYVLVPSNFAAGSSNMKSKALLVKQMDTIFQDSKAEFDLMMDQIEHVDRSMGHFIELVHALSKRLAGTQIVVRPHPAEDMGVWRRAVGALPNVHVCRKGTVTPYILGAACVVHHGCTTGFEAFLMGRPMIAYQPDYDARFDEHPANLLSRRASDLDGAIREIQTSLDGAYVPPVGARETAVENWSNFERWDACERILDVFDSADVPRVPLDGTFLRRLRAARGPLLSRAWSQGRLTVNRFIRHPVRAWRLRRYNHQKWPGTSLREIRDRITAYAEIDDRFGNVRVDKLAHGLYGIHAGDG